jgi:hypothetical protein
MKIIKIILSSFLVFAISSCDDSDAIADIIYTDGTTELIDDGVDEKMMKGFYIVNKTEREIEVYFNYKKEYFEGRELTENEKLLIQKLPFNGAYRVIIREGKLIDVLINTQIRSVYIYKNGYLIKQYEGEFYNGDKSDMNFFNMSYYQKVETKDYELYYFNVRNSVL